MQNVGHLRDRIHWYLTRHAFVCKLALIDCLKLGDESLPVLRGETQHLGRMNVNSMSYQQQVEKDSVREG